MCPLIVCLGLQHALLGVGVRIDSGAPGECQDHVEQCEPCPSNSLEVVMLHGFVRLQEGFFVQERKQHTGVGEVSLHQSQSLSSWRHSVVIDRSGPRSLPCSG